MNKEELISTILKEKLIVIIRNKQQEMVPIIVDALIDAGIRVLEITSNTPGFTEEIRSARKRHPEAIIGAGTITDVEKAELAMSAGAQFLVTPNVQAEVAAFAAKRNTVLLIGALTPTEIMMASDMGADIVKLFPADNMGIDYMKAVLAPLDQVPLFAVGGISNQNAKAWLDAGAKGLGIGGQLTKIDGTDTSSLKAAARELKAILAAF
ncbi:MAG: bifunctional 4-hydroxy-2-oxoglutarate aldolase/2-dehydro-3-deoxy-phosphogluconate aldolase [Bacteroidota bacterium]